MYFIAEIGVNHGGSMECAKTMIQQIADAGAQAAKFQTYKASKLAAKNSPAYWDLEKESTTSQFDLFKKFDSFGRDEYVELAGFCQEKNIDFISTPFDVECLDWLIPLMPVVKVASADLTNYILLEKIAEHNKELIISVGASSDFEIESMLKFLSEFDVPKICLLHCMLLYPTPKKHAYLSRIKHLKNQFEGPNISIGYSDHVAPNEANNDQLIAAFALGASTIEKHFTDDKKQIGNDHYHALDFEDLKNVISRLINTENLMGDRVTEEQLLSLQDAAIQNARRSLFYSSGLKAGSVLSMADLVPKRPGFGVGPENYRDFVGKTLYQDVVEEEMLDPKHFIDNNGSH